MRVNLKCFSELAKAEACDYRDSTVYDLNDGQTLEDLIGRAGIAKEKVKIAFLNNKTVSITFLNVCV